MFRRKKENRSYEEWMYNHGAIDLDYLNQDMELLLDIIDHFHPDRIITLDRLAAVSAGRLKSVPVDAVVDSGMYKVVRFPSSTLKEYNQFLSSWKLEQVLSLQEIYKQCANRFGFGPVETQPFPVKDDVKRIGMSSVCPLPRETAERICIYLPDLHKTSLAAKKILSESFLGASKDVYLWYPGCRAQKVQNIQFLASPRADMIPGCRCVIHDGSDFYMNQCIANGIPQIIVASHECARMYNGQAVQRTGIGRFFYEEDLSVASLYENYQKVLADDMYLTSSLEMKEKITEQGDLTRLLEYWKQ